MIEVRTHPNGAVSQTHGPSAPDLVMFTPEELSALLKVKEGTLERWRALGKGPPYIKLGRGLVRYARSDVVQWVQSGRVQGD